MSVLGGLLLRPNAVSKELLTLNKVYSEPIVALNKDLTTFATNNTNSQVVILTSFEDASYFYLYCKGQSDNIANQDLTYLKKLDKTAVDLNVEWPWIETAGVPDIILGAGADGEWDDWQVSMSTVMENPDDITGDGKSYIGYYAGNDGTGALPGGTGLKIGIATSDNLITWTKYVSNPIFQDTNGGEYDVGNNIAKVVRLSANNYVMLYSGVILGGTYYLNKATSTDGIIWTVEERKILDGIITRSSDIDLIGARYYFKIVKTPTGGNICNPEGTITSNDGTYRDIHLYSTNDFVTYIDHGIMFANTDQEIAEGFNVNCRFHKDVSGVYWSALNRTKWDIQVFNSIPKGEQFTEAHILRAEFPDFDISDESIAYPDYVDFYDVNALKEVTGTDYTGVWQSSPEFVMVHWVKPQTDYITFANWDIDVDNFAVKFKIQLPSGFTGGATEGMLLAARDGTSNDVFQMFINASDIVVVLYNSSGAVAKNYRSTNALSTYITDVANNDTIDVGFIWDGTLKICAGYTLDIPTDKTTDNALTALNGNSAPLLIGTNQNLGNYANVDMTGICMLLGADATEENWLKLSIV